MAYILKLGTFAKKRNSTAQPDMTGWADYAVTLKNGSDLVNPSVYIKISESEIVNYNYAYMLGSYYYIVQKNMDRKDLCTMQLQKDVLASYKAEIGSSNLYILRSSATYDGNIVDNHYPTTGNIYYGHSEDDAYTPAWASYGLGQYIVNVMGTATTGSSTLWKLTPTAFRQFISGLYSNIDGFQPTDIGDSVRKLLGGSPEKLVSSAMWFPAMNFPAGNSESIVVGTWNSGVSGNLISDPIYTFSPISLPIPKHPQAANRGAFLNLAPYSTYTLTLPIFGSVNIDTTLIKDADTLYINIKVDATNGQAKARVHAGSTAIIADLTAQLGSSIPLQGQSNGASMLSGITSTLAGLAGAAIAPAGAAAGALISAGASGIGTAVNALAGTSCSVGSAGGALALMVAPQINSVHLCVTDEDRLNNGRPYCRQSTPAALGGYMTAYKAPLSISATVPEVDEIQNYLTSGFYYE